MKRRDIVKVLGLGVAAAGLAACTEEKEAVAADCAQPAAAMPEKPETVEWKMVTAWPKNFPVLGTGANELAELIGQMSGGRIHVKVYGANELVGALEIFDAVSRGTAEMGHGASYYWKGKIRAAQFFAAVPFGLTAQEMNAWLYQGGGMELWEEAYAEFGLIPGAAGNTGVQMGGWFNREINSVADLNGLKMRIPGLGGEVLKRAGGTPVLLSGGEIFPSLQSGAIDATEWVGPYNDLAFGLHKAAKFYYYPGWHEPGTTQECFINKEAFEKLPADLQLIVRSALRIANQNMLADFTTKNNQALQQLVDEEGVELRKFPDDVLRELRTLSAEVVAEEAAKDPMSQKVYDSFVKFREQSIKWHAVSEQAYLNARSMN
ncbi:TRAP transporter substrate-binding protein [Amphritea sp. 2_MG-2023]|uniref:TRAP transporter substrate-binding protein n=1 Tax=Amphritea TaxID=515417 RepID=UPI001C0748F2|nr:TRAP transporter substrate-binding protein [Amphritea sp. 2_MG-2023]MBU2967713.1 TRAP transporter substrate-binding protein [Amphritea atlantica]MDO6416969.1 TRAP transporter substrate-binding protein [Amphritea sp. 2_MG-2023]MDX2424160.1 TRAP transporter substrate-binding protein [Amphritea sp.]